MATPSPDLAFLSEWGPELAQTFAALAGDIALVLDDNGVIRSVAQGSSATVAKSAQSWIGRSWADTVTGETRGKVELMLKEVSATGLARRREINHPAEKGGNIAIGAARPSVRDCSRASRLFRAVQKKFWDCPP